MNQPNLKTMLRDLNKWRALFPTKLELATSRHSHPYGIKQTTTIHPLPFNAEQWLDDPQAGLDGAKTWQALENELTAWCQTILDVTPKDPIQHMLTHINQIQEHTEAAELTKTVRTIWERVRKTIGYADQHGPQCIQCTNDTTKTYTINGWDGLYHCEACETTYTPKTYTLMAKAKARKTTTPLTTTQIRQIFPNITSHQLRQWKHRGKLNPAGKTKNGETLWKPNEIAKLAKNKP